MKTSKKRVFGLIGLLTVGAMTIAAINLPSSDAAAKSTDIEVQVNVNEAALSASFNYPQDGAVLLEPQLEVSSNYSHATDIQYYLYYTNADGQEIRQKVAEYRPSSIDDSGIYTFNIDLDSYGGLSQDRLVGDYRLVSIARNANSGAEREDSVGFVYRAMTARYDGTNANSDPKIAADVSSKVEKVQVQAYDKDGNALFVDENGAETPILIDRDEFDGNHLDLVLPFKEYGAANGKYTAVLVSYDGADNIIGINPVDFNYDKNSGATDPSGKPIDDSTGTPEVPDTGLSSNALNISRLDYILSGVIVFSLVSGFALYLILRRSRR